MKQSRMNSLIETALSTAVGFVVALLTQLFVFPLYGFHPHIDQNLAITLIFTVVSIVRQYGMRRLFETFRIRRPLSPFLQAVIEERFRQIEKEGWSLRHDDLEHGRGDLGRAGACYLIHAGTVSPTPPHDWPWDGDWWKPHGMRRDLVRGCALGIAEGERFDRMRKPSRITALPVPIRKAQA